MNWYKIAQNVQFLSYNSYEELKIFINGKTYTYYGVSPHQSNKIKWMIESKKIPNGVILNQLRQFSDNEKYNKLNPPVYSPEEKLEIIDELVERGILK